MNDTRFSITPEVLLQQHPIIIWQSYPVEEVAKIAAGCAGGTPQDRILEALKLLSAAEEIAIWTPWTDQHLRREEGDGLGDIPDFQREQVVFEFEQMAPEFIRHATNEDGQIARKELCKIACAKAGRVGKNEEPLSEDRTEALFLEGWLPYAADSRGRWEVFRQIESERKPPCDAVIAARNNTIAAQAKSDELAARWQVIREEKDEAYRNGSSKAVVDEIEIRNLIAESAFRSSKEEAWNAERHVSLAWSNFYTDEVDRRREALTEDQRKQECEAFRLSFEKGIETQPRIIRDNTQARLILLGNHEFHGLLEFLKFPPPKESRSVTPPRPKDELGRFMTRPKSDSGEFTPWGDDGSAAGEYPIAGRPNEPVERTEANRLRKKK